MAWLLPVGTPGGICSGLDEIPDGSGIVRLGEQTMYLDLAMYRVWRAAAAAPQIEELIDWATTQGIGEAESLIRDLEGADLVVAERPDVAARIGRLAIRLTGECLGNGGDRALKFTMIGQNGARLGVDAYFFELLFRTDGVSQISILCGALDEARPELGYRPGLDALRDGLPMLVRSGVVQVDAARRS
jgi:hypothetical protein